MRCGRPAILIGQSMQTHDMEIDVDFDVDVNFDVDFKSKMISKKQAVWGLRAGIIFLFKV